jgi:hypothetical protein
MWVAAVGDVEGEARLRTGNELEAVGSGDSGATDGSARTDLRSLTWIESLLCAVADDERAKVSFPSRPRVSTARRCD